MIFYKLIIIPTKSHQTYLLAYEKETKNVFNFPLLCKFLGAGYSSCLLLPVAVVLKENPTTYIISEWPIW